MTAAARGGRGLTIFAVTFLGLDAVLIGYAGLRLHRPGLLVAAAVLLVAAGGVVLLWRRQRARLAEIGAARAALKDEVSDIRSLVQSARSTRHQGP